MLDSEVTPSHHAKKRKKKNVPYKMKTTPLYDVFDVRARIMKLHVFEVNIPFTTSPTAVPEVAWFIINFILKSIAVAVVCHCVHDSLGVSAAHVIGHNAYPKALRHV